jgi:hypothetical protein
MSKGSTPRPYSVDQKTFDKNWEAIFKKQPEQLDKDKEKKDELGRTNQTKPS